MALLMAMGFAKLRLSGTAAAAIAALFVVLLAGAGLRVAPRNLDGAQATSEARFLLALDPAHPDAHWVRAIREQTPDDTILVGNGFQYHVSVYTNRSLYFPVETNGGLSTGYSLGNIFNLTYFRGAPLPLVRRRGRIVSAIYGDERWKFRFALNKLRKLSRPVALILSPGGGRQLEWLEELGEGELLETPNPQGAGPDSATRLVWLFDRPATSTTHVPMQ